MKNILDGKGTRATAGGVFSFKTVIILIVLGAFSFSAYFVLAGFASDLRSTNNGGEHALSKSAIGFAGLVHILKENGQSVSITREPAYRRADKRKLKIITVPVGFFPVALDEIEFKQPTLIVLPKWQTRPMPGHKGWVRKLNAPNKPIVPVGRISQKLTPITGEIEITRSNKDSERVHIQPANRDTDSAEYQIFNFENLQTIDGKNLLPIYITDQGPVLAQVKDSQTFILSDPDFMNTHSITKSTIAAFADNIVNRIQEKTGTRDVVFDLSLHGFTGSQNLIKLALTAPFLGATLALLA
ncbi:MAG TPA: hypothetical protein ENJ42_08020, partial [Hellea balneolensis]|nr:hypothetical protein [Hellea balneolensis]